MEQAQRIHENTEQRKVQFKNFAAMNGLDAESLTEVILQEFSSPWAGLKASRKRGRLLSRQFLRCYNKNPGQEDSYQTVVWRSLFMPTEIIYAMGLMPLTVEMVAAQFAMSGLANARLETAEGSGFSPDLCSFIKAGAGAVLENVLPSPDILLSTSHLCDPAAKFSAYIAHKYNRPEFIIDVPFGVRVGGGSRSDLQKAEDAVDFVAGQLEDMVAFITRETGLKLDDAKLAAVLQRSNEARKWLKMGNEFARFSRPAVTTGSKELDYAANLMQTWGTEEIIDVYRTRYEEFQAAAARSSHYDPGRPRIIWAHLRPYYKNTILQYIEERADIVESMANYVYWEKMDVLDPFRSMARRMVLNQVFYPVRWRAEFMIEKMQEGESVIAFYPKSCRHFHSCARMEAEMFKKAGISMLAIDGDCIDNRGDDFLVLKTRIDRFLKSLQQQAQSETQQFSLRDQGLR